MDTGPAGWVKATCCVFYHMLAVLIAWHLTTAAGAILWWPLGLHERAERGGTQVSLGSMTSVTALWSVILRIALTSAKFSCQRKNYKKVNKANKSLTLLT